MLVKNDAIISLLYWKYRESAGMVRGEIEKIS